MNDLVRTILREWLWLTISEISEWVYRDSWHGGIERLVWNECHGIKPGLEEDIKNPGLLEKILAVGKELGEWPVYDGKATEWVKLEEWRCQAAKHESTGRAATCRSPV